ncbi:AAA+ ATPase domain-containing protein [Artemisia annua]|uniref:AAA+ ATPase domain-containing protein n=1 Tax=Artemisia annua TaxID=35608 RepID=A0A2U1NPH8_ARTAN|nr:AAA+ ATPase domain-containing protein [Artemisia annua]
MDVSAVFSVPLLLFGFDVLRVFWRGDSGFPAKVLRIILIAAVKWVEQELWQREEKRLIGILPVRDAAETLSVASMLTEVVAATATSLGHRKDEEMMETNLKVASATTLIAAQCVEVVVAMGT